MSTPQITIHNAATGETITRDYNKAELAQHEIDKAQAAKDAADKTKADADKQAARQAVLDKLGLTADEIAALLG
jgi:selenocysteine lyase/cysteine desulfurase